MAAIYHDLRRLAAKHMAAESGPQTLTATALVHEAWLRMGAPAAHDSTWKNRRHFFDSAAQEDCEIIAPMPDDELLAADDALERLRGEDPLAGEIVALRCFAGLKWAEISDLTGLTAVGEDAVRQAIPGIHIAWDREVTSRNAPMERADAERKFELFFPELPRKSASSCGTAILPP